MSERPFREIVHVRVPPEMAEAMRQAAAREDRTISSWVRHRIRHSLIEDQLRREIAGRSAMGHTPEARP